jgi:hypothetical protein
LEGKKEWGVAAYVTDRGRHIRVVRVDLATDWRMEVLIVFGRRLDLRGRNERGGVEGDVLFRKAC